MKNIMNLQPIDWCELPVTDLGHVMKEIDKQHKVMQAIKEWRHDCNMRTKHCQKLAKQRRSTV